MFAEVQPSKGVENYFTVSLLYKESNKGVKELLPDSGNVVDSESEEDAPATLIFKPMVAYLENPDCNNPTENEGEWVLNEDVTLDYFLCLEDVLKSANFSPLHMPLLIAEIACMHI